PPVITTRPTGHQPRAIRRFRVTVTSGPAAGASWNGPGERCAIGSHAGNDLVIDDTTVSRFHCELAVAGDGVRVRDLGSRNRTLAGGIALADAIVCGGTVLALGNSDVRVDVDPERTEVVDPDRTSFGTLIGESAAMRDVFAQLDKIAASDATVLIEGETGTGKEGAAAAIHDASPRADGPFIVVDCGAIPPNLVESELFGHEPGAFTGAVDRRIGAFEQASGGTLFLDEIGELPPELQPKFLRVLESREIRRVGATAALRCDLRIIAATNRDLRAEVNRGTFRADLYYRLAVVKLSLPPLRERPGDIALLAHHLLAKLGAPPATLATLTAPDYLATLAAAPWPGNVRELRNHLEQCAVFGERQLPAAAAAAPHTDAAEPYEIARRRALDAFERSYLTRLLDRTGGNVMAASRDASVNRAYLYRMLRRHGLR
ncbi:MAG TPA: sigma 54-interacting transcriptional regulator, partial [Kofleriaceae bacterium]